MYRFQFDFTPLNTVALDHNFTCLAAAIEYLQRIDSNVQAPFTISGPVNDLFQVSPDGSAFLGNGLSMDAGGHTWLYQGVTTYPFGGLSGEPTNPSVTVHGNANATGGWISFLDDVGTAENYIGGIGGGNTLPGTPDNWVQIQAPNGLAMGSTDNVVTVSPSPPAVGAQTQDVATTAFVNPAYHRGEPGFAQLPCGVVLQWGAVTFNNTSPQNVSFYTPFSTTYSVQLSMTSDFSGQDYVPRVRSGSLSGTGFQLGFDAFGGSFDAPQVVYWFAVGQYA
jgi:hypothetical protein